MHGMTILGGNQGSFVNGLRDYRSFPISARSRNNEVPENTNLRTTDQFKKTDYNSLQKNLPLSHRLQIGKFRVYQKQLDHRLSIPKTYNYRFPKKKLPYFPTIKTMKTSKY